MYTAPLQLSIEVSYIYMCGSLHLSFKFIEFKVMFLNHTHQRFQVLRSHMWPGAMMVDRAGTEHVHHHKTLLACAGVFRFLNLWSTL